jgi:sugar phosphate isomerase/epimerase
MMRFAYSTNAFRLFPLDRAVRDIAALGFEGIELLADFPHAWPADIVAKPGSAGAIRDLFGAAGLTLTNVNTYTAYAIGDDQRPTWIGSDDDTALRREFTRQAIAMSALVGAPGLTVMPGGRLDVDGEAVTDERRAWAWQRFRNELQALAPAAAAAGVTLLIEPEPGNVIERYTDFLTLIGELPESVREVVGMNLDVGHLVCAGDDVVEGIHACRDWIRHVHLEDIAHRRHVHLAVGDGEIDFVPILRALDGIGYAGWLTLELYTRQDDPVGAGRQSLSALRDALDTALGGA